MYTGGGPGQQVDTKYIPVYTFAVFIENVIRALDKANVHYCLVGGYAVALHGAVRGTVDLDFVVALEEAQFVAVEKALQAIGLSPRLPVSAHEVFQFREEYIHKRHLVAWSFVNMKDPLEVVDIIITHDANDMEVVSMTAGKLKLRVAAIDELIKMKRLSDRPQDREDIKALERLK